MRWINSILEEYKCLFVIKLHHFNRQAIYSKAATASSGADIGDRLNPETESALANIFS